MSSFLCYVYDHFLKLRVVVVVVVAYDESFVLIFFLFPFFSAKLVPSSAMMVALVQP